MTVQNEGNREVKRKNSFYNLDVIISAGYRVNSKNATHFNMVYAATERLNHQRICSR
ncbi:MAG: virulence RhuM family protein [Methanobrevibacter sp.]|nr:virulence RhuM family protein [Methanobrevibacter sp.]